MRRENSAPKPGVDRYSTGQDMVTARDEEHLSDGICFHEESEKREKS
jgi:hypothetical protein